MSLAFGRYSARSGLRARGGSECRSKPGQPCTHGINLGVKKRTSLITNLMSEELLPRRALDLGQVLTQAFNIKDDVIASSLLT